MLRKKSLSLLLIALAFLSFVFLAFRHWKSPDALTNREDLLASLPGDASAAGFLDLQQFRASPFLAQIFSWAPQAAPDSEYAQFLQATGFDYERDLDRIAVAVNRESQIPWVYAVAEGRFDRKKIEGYASRFGSLKTAGGKTLFAVPINGSPRKAYFTFLRDNRVAWANDSSCFFQRPQSAEAQAWREHFSRVAGTPIFAVLQQDSGAAAALAQVPSGFRSPQLATLLSQLQWITLSGKPDGNSLRVVLDGESTAETTTHQLKELLDGLVILAQAGLNDAKTRTQVDPQLRQGYRELLQSADIQQLDRGTSKSVRVILEVPARLLQPPQTAALPAADPPAPAKHKVKKQYAK